MRFVIFTHSIRSDWNHGHVHFLRGVVSELLAKGHEVQVFEPEDAWSVTNLVRDHGASALDAYATAYPKVAPHVRVYDPAAPPLAALREADVVLLQEWSDPALVDAVAQARLEDGGFRLYFHDAHHRSVTDPEKVEALGTDRFDAVLAFGDVVRERYLEEGWAARAYTWHEAADARVFRPIDETDKKEDLTWIGNWGDEERTREYRHYLLDPAKRLGLSGTVYGVRYPEEGRAMVRDSGLRYGGYLPNHEVPRALANHRATVHIPRRAYREELPGIPTIRVFEALACGVPLVSAPWEDREGLFRPGTDFLVAHTEDEMVAHLRDLMDDEALRARLGAAGRRTIEERHTCRHRVEELEQIDRTVRGGLYPMPETHPVSAGASSMDDAAAEDAQVEEGLEIAFFGSSLVSSYWNGAATYYRGLLRSLARQGCRITFYEPDAYDRQAHRDIADPDWARVVVYPAEDTSGARRALESARGADVVVKASGVGVHDGFLEREVLKLQSPDTQVVFWDVDAPATLERMAEDPKDPFRALVPQYDLVCTYGGGPPVVAAYEEAGAARCVPVYNALDPETHHPVPRDPRLEADLSFLGNRLPDREERVRKFFLEVAEARPHKRFLIGGSGWEANHLPPNVRHYGHVPTAIHNAFNRSARAVLNINRDSMARFGYSPATRVFEAAGAGACLITDAFRGVETFFEPGKELLVAETGAEVAEILDGLDEDKARRIGTRARARALAAHTYDHRAADVMELLGAPRKEVILR